ncbi:MAG: hypothetical protein M1812_005313 [Candelaria pacifica]|nr:MAG: hypothetical protein M1812_005313 [Candelaria pacifica]
MPFPFLKLPGELRNYIYEYLLTGPAWENNEDYDPYYRFAGVIVPDFDYPQLTSSGFFSILHVNRQVYTEALPILYSKNKFLFAKNLEPFLAKVNPTVYQSISQINLNIGYVTDEGFRLLAQLTSLSSLVLSIPISRKTLQGRIPLWDAAGMEELRKVRVYGPLHFIFWDNKKYSWSSSGLRLMSQRRMDKFAVRMCAVMEKSEEEIE